MNDYISELIEYIDQNNKEMKKNTMMTKVNANKVNDSELVNIIIDRMRTNNAIYFPDIERVTYSIGDKKVLDKAGNPTGDTRKVLTTTVFFADDTKVVVQNCEKDQVYFNEDGTASIESKEMGLVYAIAKRILGSLDNKTGHINTGNFGGKLRNLVKNAYDENIAKAKKAEEKAAKKAKKAEMKKAEPKKIEHKSVEQKLSELTDVVNNLAKVVATMTESKDAVKKEEAKKRVTEKITKAPVKKTTVKKSK